MDNQDQPKLDDNSLETSDEAAGQTGVVIAPAQTPGVPTPPKNDKKVGTNKTEGLIKRVFNVINIYFLLLILVLVALGGAAYYAYLQTHKNAKQSTLTTQKLSQDSLDKLAGTDSSVGDAKQTLSVESNAVFAGAVLVRGNLDIAGTIKIGGSLSLPSLNVGGASILEQVSVKSLTVAGDMAIQGKFTALGGLTIKGSSTFSGPISAPQLTVDSLQLSKDLQLSRHITTTGGVPSRTNGGALGSGGTASLSGTDTAGTITINTGNAAPSGCFITVTFTAAFAGTPHVVISPSSSTAAAFKYYTTRSNTGFSVCSADDPPDNSAGMTFDYIVIG